VAKAARTTPHSRSVPSAHPSVYFLISGGIPVHPGGPAAALHVVRSRHAADTLWWGYRALRAHHVPWHLAQIFRYLPPDRAPPLLLPCHPPFPAELRQVPRTAGSDSTTSPLGAPGGLLAPVLCSNDGSIRDVFHLFVSYLFDFSVLALGVLFYSSSGPAWIGLREPKRSG